MFLALGDPDHAIHCLLRATNLDTTNTDAFYYLGVTAANKGHLDDAVQFFSHALDLDSEHIGALRDSAFTYVAAGRIEKAAERIAQARAILPGDCELRVLDYGVRMMRATDRLKQRVRRLDPRKLLRRHG